MDRGTWQAMVHGVAKSRTHLSGATNTFTLHTFGPLRGTFLIPAIVGALCLLCFQPYTKSLEG